MSAPLISNQLNRAVTFNSMWPGCVKLAASTLSVLTEWTAQSPSHSSEAFSRLWLGHMHRWKGKLSRHLTVPGFAKVTRFLLALTVRPGDVKPFNEYIGWWMFHINRKCQLDYRKWVIVIISPVSYILLQQNTTLVPICNSFSFVSFKKMSRRDKWQFIIIILCTLKPIGAWQNWTII